MLQIMPTAKECDFNSIKVRLKQFDAIGFEATPRFQFHKGTIKTR